MTSGLRQPTVLVVCTANICRSPVAEAVLRAAIGRDGGITVGSAGLHARVGGPVDARMAALIDEPLDGFAARQLTADLVRGADLVLTMTRDQRRSLVTASPSAVRRTFTLREFADLARLVHDGPDEPAGATPAERLAALVAAAPKARSRRTPGQDDDVADPYGRSVEDHARAVALIRAAVGDIAVALGAGGSTATPRP